MILLPICALFVAATQSFDWAYLSHFFRNAAWGYVSTTLIVTLGVTFGCLLIGGCTSWLTSHYRFMGSSFLQWALILPLVFPSDVIGLVYRDFTAYYGPLWQFVKTVFGVSIPLKYWFVEMESWAGLIFVLSLSLYPFAYIILYTAWRAQPRTYHEIGASLGLTPRRAALKITIPLAMPAILVSCLVSSFLALNDYVTILLFGKRGIAVAIHNMWHGFHRPVVASQLAAALVVGIFVLLLLVGWFAVNRNYYDPIIPKGLRPQGRLRGVKGGATFLASSLPFFLGFLLPTGLLIWWAIPRVSRINGSHLYLYVKNTLAVSVFATIACLLLALFFVLKDLDRPSSNREKLHLLGLNAGYFVPSIAIAVGVLLLLSWSKDLFLSSFLSNSIVALVYAVSVRLFCLPFLSLSIGRKKIPAGIHDLLRQLHRGFAFKVSRIYLPLLKPWILAGALITFISTLKELNLSLALAPVNFVSLSTRIYFSTSHENVKQSAVWCLCLALMALLPVIMISRRLTNTRG